MADDHNSDSDEHLDPVKGVPVDFEEDEPTQIYNPSELLAKTRASERPRTADTPVVPPVVPPAAQAAQGGEEPPVSESIPAQASSRSGHAPPLAPETERRLSRPSPEDDARRPALFLAEYDTPNAVARAAMRVRDAGYERWDCHTPYPLHGLDEAMGLEPTTVGRVSFWAGMFGVLCAVLLIQWANNWSYPIIVGGKPPGAFPSMVPIMFELGILICGFGTLFGMLMYAKLPRHNHPIFESDRFEAASDDKFFISIEAEDSRFDLDRTRALLESTNPTFIELVTEEIQ
ncbi:MAG: DUF3341 domain-containing protein [Myxococcales bacterium]|nr:DUF3341 domain-containing protein [Myxococcales bacterium]